MSEKSKDELIEAQKEVIGILFWGIVFCGPQCIWVYSHVL